MTRICEWCGKENTRSKSLFCSKACYYARYQQSGRGRIAQAKYQRSGKGKITKANYRRSDKSKTAQAEYTQKYILTDKGKTVHAKAKAKYSQSDKGKATQIRYRESDKGKATRAKHWIDYKQSGKAKTIWDRRNHERILKSNIKIDPELKCAGCCRTDCKLEKNHNKGDGRRDIDSWGGSVIWMDAIINGKRPIDDLSLLCDQCHDIFHRKGRWIEYLKSYTNDQKDYLLKFLKNVDPLFNYAIIFQVLMED